MIQLLTQKEIEHAIFDGIYPTKVFKVGSLSFIYVISERMFPTTIEGWLNFFKYAISIPSLEDSRDLLRLLPIHLFYKLIKDYKTFYKKWFESIVQHILPIISDARSRTTWSVCKHTSINLVLPVYGRLNTAQYFWVALNSSSDTSERNKLILDVFEMIKPWMNIELWNQIQRNDNGGGNRINRLEEQDVDEYIASLEENNDEISMS